MIKNFIQKFHQKFIKNEQQIKTDKDVCSKDGEILYLFLQALVLVHLDQ